MKAGFTLIEMLLVLALSSLLLLILFGAFTQSNKFVQSANEYIDTYTPLTIAYHQCNKDISGATVPLHVFAQEKDEKEKKAQEEKQAQKLTKIFFFNTKEGQLDTFTCISNNPMQTYWSDRVGKARPYLVRVVYRLLVDEDDEVAGPPSYKLVRQSDSELDFDVYKSGGKIREYTLLRNIKQIFISSTALIETQENETTKRELQTFDTWDSDSPAVKRNKKPVYIPNAITLKIVLWDNEKINSEEFVVTIVIPADPRSTPLPKKERVPSKKDLKKPKSMVRLPSMPKRPGARSVLPKRRP